MIMLIECSAEIILLRVKVKIFSTLNVMGLLLLGMLWCGKDSKKRWKNGEYMFRS